VDAVSHTALSHDWSEQGDTYIHADTCTRLRLYLPLWLRSLHILCQPIRLQYSQILHGMLWSLLFLLSVAFLHSTLSFLLLRDAL